MDFFHKLRQKTPKQFIELSLLNIGIIALGSIYLLLRYKFLNDLIPFWYTMPWGNSQLATKKHIILIPLVSFLITAFGIVASLYAKKKFVRHGGELILIVLTFCNIALAASLVRIILKTSVPIEPLIDPNYVKLLLPFVVSFALAYTFTPRFIEFAKEKSIVTDPAIHQHPGMLLKKPSVRGGGVVFSLVFAITTLLFVPSAVEILGIVFAVLITGLIGFLDDIANTNPHSKFKIFGNPVFRLIILQPIPVLFIFFSGIRILNIGNPFGGVFALNEFLVNIGPFILAPLSIGITIFWMLWVMNMLSFSNGVDGQYSGIVGTSSIVIALLSLRFLPLDPQQLYMAKVAAITAGASFGLAKYTWYPSRIMWGFSATSAGIILATLSIVSVTKIAIAILVLLIPFLDALITILRRLFQGSAPWKGDRGHLHHLLLERGWSVKKIAIFYWITSALLGAGALLSSEKAVALVVLTLSGIIATILISLNLKSKVMKQARQLLEK